MANVEPTTPADGRAARRQRNIDTVIDTAIELFRAGNTELTVEVVAEQSGVSVRSIYRYFDDPVELRKAAIERTLAAARAAADIPNTGQGPLEERIDAFTASRLRLHQGFGAIQQASIHQSFEVKQAHEQVEANRRALRGQLRAQFAPEFDALDEPARSRTVAAADLLTQLEAVHVLRTSRGFTVAETRAVLADGLQALLT